MNILPLLICIATMASVGCRERTFGGSDVLKSSSEPCAKPSGQAEQEACAKFRKADSALNVNYKKVRASYSAEQKATLLDAQRAWISYRDYDCKARTAGAERSSGALVACQTRLTQTRADYFEKMSFGNTESVKKCDGSGQLQMNKCVADLAETARIDAEKNIEEFRKKNPAASDSLASAQHNWEAMTTNDCSLLSSQEEGGSLAPFIKLECTYDHHMQRALDFRFTNSQAK